MRRQLVTTILALTMSAALLAGCASMGLENPFASDPFTGGVDTTTSALLNVPLPAGLQRYASHGYSATSAAGGREGLEVLRGNVNAGACAMEIFSALKSHGWQLRLALHKNDHMLEVYEKGAEMAVLTFRSQAMLTILEIWLGQRLPDGATLEMPLDDPGVSGGGAELAGEEYGPLTGLEESYGGGSAPAPKPGTVEQWGVEERSL
ncbi:hypothetical protein [Desulfovibrio sp.]|uniref:hypothetical protein n=1 Tax=Desulfovibrio sp. TaxID=885 RepID=UPI0023C807D0|nr:hypothetical protein [Desulfovibrio sp.]MDE7240714.1 hypothetical protein [Desulfovibrio sp.]